MWRGPARPHLRYPKCSTRPAKLIYVFLSSEPIGYVEKIRIVVSNEFTGKHIVSSEASAITKDLLRSKKVTKLEVATTFG